MLWIIISIVCGIYYILVRYVAQSQQLTGIWLILAVLFFVLFLWRWHVGRAQRGKPLSLRVRTFLITTAALFLIMTGVVAGRILVSMWSSAPQQLPYILLLNQGDIAAETEAEWEMRLDTAIRYLQANESTRVVVSGGWDMARGSSEAHLMYAYLLENGISGKRIYWEIRSETTKQNLDLARPLTEGDRHPVGIVASDYSMYRILRTARNQGYTQAEAIPCGTTPWLYPHRFVQEILQVLYDKFFGI